MKPTQLAIEKAIYGGDCLAHHERKAIFVPLTLPGETVEAQLTTQKRSFDKAEISAILTASPHRIEPLCPHFGICGGCHYQHTDYANQLALKQQILRETLTRVGVPVPAEILQLSSDQSGNAWHYRNRIRLAFTPDGTFGYRSRRSHDIVAIAECPIAAPILLQTAFQIAQFLVGNPAPTPISELELFTNPEQTQLLLTLFTESAPKSSPQAWLAALHAAHHAAPPAESTSLRLQLADGALHPKILAQAGQPSLTYTAAEFPYRVDHGAFFQVNRHLLDPFIAAVTENQSGSLAWDLYAGVGLFARRLASSFTQVLAVESASASWEALQHNLAGTSARPVGSTTLDFLRRNRQEREPRPDLIVLDPPRAGLGDEVTTLLNAIHAPAMVYVSCDPATLARDLRALTQERFHIASITQADMFPQTFHMETIVHLRRQ